MPRTTQADLRAHNFSFPVGLEFKTTDKPVNPTQGLARGNIDGARVDLIVLNRGVIRGVIWSAPVQLPYLQRLFKGKRCYRAYMAGVTQRREYTLEKFLDRPLNEIVRRKHAEDWLTLAGARSGFEIAWLNYCKSIEEFVQYARRLEHRINNTERTDHA